VAAVDGTASVQRPLCGASYAESLGALAEHTAGDRVGGFIARDMWLLKVRRFPLMVDVVLYVLVLGGLGFLIVGKETKFFEWNSLHLDIPISFLMGAASLGAWMTEARKNVRIYVGARHLVFVKATDGP
jgi:hypothetical protein